ncbi:hypothetical protein TARUN_2750 [Trichoderma arundinaceum]|uniref:Uncharacterized protein n=1 Tax=Trichoderma arundinaceum TaxID=490622 RepID=A0A395NU30_TRIAR|nr:hypothetical protein TARUN_2750 [Trichoderma arundinaceum]
MDSVHNPPTGFSSRRAATGSLPTFSLPPPQSEVPSMDDQSSRPRSWYSLSRNIDLTSPPGASEGLSPSLSSVHTSSSQGSQAPTMQQYTYSGHVHGSWPTPGSSSYGVNSGPAGQQPGALQTPLQTPGGSSYAVNPANGTAQHSLGASPYGGRSSMYGQSGLYGHQRGSPPPTTGGESLPGPPFDSHSFQSSNGQDGHSGMPSTNMLSSHASQAPASSSASAHVDSYTHSRSSISGPSYTSSSAPQHQSSFPYGTQPSPTNHSPTGAASLPRGLGSLSNQPSLPSMAPPASYRPYQTYQQLPTMGGPVMSNIHQPGSQLSMIPGMVPAAYGPATTMMYQHTHPQPQSERPFKCDQLVKGCENKSNEHPGGADRHRNGDVEDDDGSTVKKSP